MKISFFDHRSVFKIEKDLIENFILEVGLSDKFILKEHVVEFESAVCQYTGAQDAVAVSNGTYGLIIGLAALDVKPGVDVLTPAFSFISSASAIAFRGATPVFVDVDPNTYTINPVDITEKITPNSKVIIPVHLFSTLAKMDEIKNIAKEYNLAVLEDSAVSFGSHIGSDFAGLLGDLGVYSFFPAKPLGGIGDGGMIVTNNKELGLRCRMLRNHGQDGKNRFLHHELGYNSRMDELMALYLSHSIKTIDLSIEKRKKIACYYNERLQSLEPKVKLPPQFEYDQVYYIYAIQVDERDELRSFLLERGIETKKYFSTPLHLQPSFLHLGYKQGDFPVSEMLSRRILALPFHPNLSEPEADKVTEAIHRFYETRKYSS